MPCNSLKEAKQLKPEFFPERGGKKWEFFPNGPNGQILDLKFKFKFDTCVLSRDLPLSFRNPCLPFIK